MTTTNSYGDTSAARLGANHGYRIQGELACLNAELAIARDADAFARQWAVQLWACDTPYGGGMLTGVKVAEAALSVDAQAQPQQLYAETLAHLPASGRDYSMVLVLASGQAGSFDRVHDFANYPARERFVAPYLEGNVGYAIDGESVVVHAERVSNPRSAQNSLSALALELWALNEPYAGEQFSGYALAGVELGKLPGQQSFELVECRLAFTPPPAGQSWNVALMLREWTSDGYVTRDYRNFAAPMVWHVEPVSQPTLEAVKPVAAVERVVKVEPSAAKPVEAPIAAKPVVASKTVVVEDAAPVVKPTAAAPSAPAVADKPPVALAEAAAKLAAVAATASKPAAAAVAPVPPVLAKSEAPAAKRLEAPAPARAKANALVSIQTASLDELSLVKGLNKKLAAEIIKARPFRSFDELTRVRGIGDKLLRRLREELTL